MTYATIAIVALFAALFAFPPVFEGKTAKHSPIGIWRPEGPLNREGSTTAYAHVQEKGEFRLAKLGAIAVGLSFLAFTPDPVLLFAQPIAMALADQAFRFFPGTDWAGHGAEIMAAEADGALGYREAEIARMMGDSNKPDDAGEVAKGLARWRWLASAVYALGRW